MNHCIECGRKVSRGRTNHTDQEATHCLVCDNKRAMRTLHYKSTVARLRARVREMEERA
jgi:hypothetical protein